jgi:nitrate/nitrite-specific signal transduction histidine kinase
MYVVLKKTLLNRISALHHGAQELGSGNLSYRLPLSGPDEIGQLAETFNRIAMYLSDHQNRLEELVKERTEELSASEMRWKFALEGSQDGVWDLNLVTGEAFFSSMWKKIIGYENPNAKIELNDWQERIHPNDKDAVFKSINDHLQGITEYYQHEYRVMSRKSHYK